jgi:mono/diheme cytochrome c family protein
LKLIAKKLSMILVRALSPALLFGQNPEGEKLFAGQCAGCHGADAHGTDRGPGLAANRRVRSRSIQQLRHFIRRGAPGSGMPAFDLPGAQLDALAALLRTLNAPAAESAPLGDSDAGKQFFLGKGQCNSCHMVYGEEKQSVRISPMQAPE